MREYIKIAWRNIWRNKRRTLITTASIFFAVFLALLMRSFQLGSYDHMVNNAVKAFTGHIQIHKLDYWEKQDINYIFEYTPELTRKIESIENVEVIVPRLSSFALVSSGKKTKGVLVMGVDPQKEDQLTNLSSKIVDGKYPEGVEDNCVLVSKRLAKYLRINTGDFIVLTS